MCAGRHKQRAVLPGAVASLRHDDQVDVHALTWPRPLWPRRGARSEFRAYSNRARNPRACCAMPTSFFSLWQDARWRRGESVSMKSAREMMRPMEIYKRDA